MHSANMADWNRATSHRRLAAACIIQVESSSQRVAPATAPQNSVVVVSTPSTTSAVVALSTLVPSEATDPGVDNLAKGPSRKLAVELWMRPGQN